MNEPERRPCSTLPTRTAALLVLVSLGSCLPHADPKGRGEVPREASVEALLPISEMLPRVDSLHIVLGDEHYRLGQLATNELEQFSSSVFLGAVFEDGASVIVDRKSRRGIVASPSGIVSLLAPAGSGPGELQDASGMLRFADGRLGILDNHLARWTTFTVSSGRTTPLMEYPGAPWAASVCALDSAYVAMGYTSSAKALFNVLSLDGDVLASFGPPLVGGSWLLNGEMSLGPIVCLTEPHRIIAFPRTGELLSFTTDGRFLWRKAVPDFEPSGIIEKDGTLRTDVIAEGRLRSRRVAGLILLNNGIGVLQLQEYLRESPERSQSFIRGRLLTKIFDATTGSLLGEQDNLPKLLSATDSLLLLAEEDDDNGPWVRVTKYHLSPKGAQAVAFRPE